LKRHCAEAAPSLPAESLVKERFDCRNRRTRAVAQPDFLIGSRKGYQIARSLNVPLIRVGFSDP